MKRRQLLLGGLSTLTGAMASLTLPAWASQADQVRLVAAWRGPRTGDPFHAGILLADWQARRLRIESRHILPGRPHGPLIVDPETIWIPPHRPGQWLLCLTAKGRVRHRLEIPETSRYSFCGHLQAGPEADTLLATETDWSDGSGLLTIRDSRSLKLLARHPTGGRDPHQFVLDEAGKVWVANGGVLRDRADRKLDLGGMDSSLVQMDPRNGEIMGQWRLTDKRLSLRHLCWNVPSLGKPRLLGIAMQAEHASAEARRAAPVLAVFDGRELQLPVSYGDRHVGYAGDISPALQGGFVLSSNQAGRAMLWHPDRASDLQSVIELPESYALSAWPGPGAAGGILCATALGLVRWHPHAQPMLLPWPEPMALDNHWCLLQESDT